MIRHVVAWRLAATDPDERAEAEATVKSRLAALPAVITEIRSLTVGADVVGAPGAWDLCLVADFDDEEGLEAYQVHPAHQEAAAAIRAVVSERAVVDFPL